MTLHEQTTDDGPVLIPDSMLIPGTIFWMLRQANAGHWLKRKGELDCFAFGLHKGILQDRITCPNGAQVYCPATFNVEDVTATDWEIAE